MTHDRADQSTPTGSNQTPSTGGGSATAPAADGPAGPAQTEPDASRRGSERDQRIGIRRWIGPAMAAVAVVPVWVAAIRAGTQGLYPYSDAAATVLRAQGVFDGRFPLLGMKAAGASQHGFDVYFPAAWQLYALAGPTRLLGVVWGPLVTMAVMNTVWIGLTCWLLLRRLERPQAVLGIAFVAALLWSLGSGYLISPIPMQMVIVPTIAFFVAVWAVADGDLIAVPVLALVANYLWLDHLVLVLTVPLVGIVAPVGLWLWARREKRRTPRDPVRTRRIRRSLITAAVITVIMWIPAVIQQLTASPGNLRVLLANAGAERPTIGSWAKAVHYVVSPITRPDFWFRGTIENPSYLSGSGTRIAGLPVYDLVTGLVVVAAMITLGSAARRRGDRTGLWLLIVAAVGVAVSVVTTHAAPTYIGVPTGYLGSLWVVAMFVWFAIAVNLIRTLPRPADTAVLPVAAVAVVALSVANLPTANYGYGTDRAADQRVAQMNHAVVPHLEGRGPVQVIASSLDNFHYAEALRLAMVEDGIPFCVPEVAAHSDGGRPVCPPEGPATVVYVSVDRLEEETDPARGQVLFRDKFLSAAEQDELARLDRVIDDWLASLDTLALSDTAQHVATELAGADIATGIDEMFREHRRAGTPARQWDAFVSLTELWYDSDHAGAGPLFADSPLDEDQWRRWVDLTGAARALTVTAR